MPLVIQNIKKVLKPNGRVLFRDYATGDLAQERFTGKEQKISNNFYVRGDGTRAFYFSDEFLGNLFKENGFNIEEHVLHCKQVENRSKEIVMNRRWVQAVFHAVDCNLITGLTTGNEVSHLRGDSDKMRDDENEFEIDMSERMALEMFGISSSREETIDLAIRNYSFKIRVLSKEYQHTCSSTGLMLWESARLMAHVLATNQEIVSGKRVLELGSGCSGICTMIAARSAGLVVATDGDTEVLELLNGNVSSNLKSLALNKFHVKKLEWGNKNDIDAIKQLNTKGFDIIIGTDVTYIPTAIKPLFATAQQLMSSSQILEGDREPALILCHVLRRVEEPSLLSAASEYGFRLMDSWPGPTPNTSFQGIIKNWFSEKPFEIPSSALSIMLFSLSIGD